MDWVLRTNDLVKSYGKNKALNGVSMNIKKGDVYGFVGENGSGKTTVIRTVTGLIFANSGDFELFGINGKSREIFKVKNKIGGIVESPSIYKNFSARDNILMQASIIGVKYTDKVDDLLKLVGLEDVINSKKKAGDFSLGMRQRLGIAMCLVSEPEFLILDEPMNGLDPAGIVELRQLIINLNKEKGITFLISSHILTELSLVATKYGIISKGKMIKEITAEELNKELGKSIKIDVTNTDQIIEILSAIYPEININLTNTGVVINGEIDINEIIKLLAEKNIEISGINCTHTSIEDYYMNLVGGRRNA